MATLRSIIKLADDLEVNEVSQDIKIGWVNLELKRLGKKIGLKTFDRLTTVTGIQSYALPDGCSADMIESVEYIYNNSDGSSSVMPLKYRGWDQKAIGDYYTTIENSLFISVKPLTDLDDIVICSTKKPSSNLTSSNLDDELAILDDYADIISLGILIKIYQKRKDISMTNNYRMEYNQRVNELEEDRSDNNAEYTTTRDVMKKRNRRICVYMEDDLDD